MSKEKTVEEILYDSFSYCNRVAYCGSGTPIAVSVKDTAPQWVQDLVWEAHQKNEQWGHSNFLLFAIQSASVALVNCESGETFQEHIREWSSSFTPSEREWGWFMKEFGSFVSAEAFIDGSETVACLVRSAMLSVMEKVFAQVYVHCAIRTVNPKGD